MNGYLATLFILLLFVLRFLAPLTIIVLLGYFIGWLERRWLEQGATGLPPIVSGHGR